jgi:hyaluronoglucosaminidase
VRSKYFGVVEGFYGKPYSYEQRLDLIAYLADIGLNTYLYGPKDDAYHRRLWDRPYPDARLQELARLAAYAEKKRIFFNYALSPMTRPTSRRIIDKIKTLVRVGIRHFSLFYDDIRVPLSAATAERQIATAHDMLSFLKTIVRRPVVFFCPTQYYGWRETDYLMTMRKRLHKDIDVFWTGRHVVSPRISDRDIRTITSCLKRAPLIWDNIYATDYLPGVVFRYPYRFRSSAIVHKTRGVLINPMNHYRASKPLLFTAARFFSSPHTYVPRRAWKSALKVGR